MLVKDTTFAKLHHIHGTWYIQILIQPEVVRWEHLKYLASFIWNNPYIYIYIYIYIMNGVLFKSISDVFNYHWLLIILLLFFIAFDKSANLYQWMEHKKIISDKSIILFKYYLYQTDFCIMLSIFPVQHIYIF